MLFRKLEQVYFLFYFCITGNYLNEKHIKWSVEFDQCQNVNSGILIRWSATETDNKSIGMTYSWWDFFGKVQPIHTDNDWNSHETHIIIHKHIENVKWQVDDWIIENWLEPSFGSKRMKECSREDERGCGSRENLIQFQNVLARKREKKSTDYHSVLFRPFSCKYMSCNSSSYLL